MRVKIFSPVTSIALLAITLIACTKETVTQIPNPTPAPVPQSVSLVGTTWEGVINTDGYLDKSILRFITDSTGTEYSYLGHNSQTIMESTCDIVYYFDSLMMNGLYYAVTPYGNGEPWSFVYNLDDTTLIIPENNRIYHIVDE